MTDDLLQTYWESVERFKIIYLRSTASVWATALLPYTVKESLCRLPPKFLNIFSATLCKLLKWRKEKTYIQNIIHHYITSNSIILNMYNMYEKDEKKILILFLPTTESSATLSFYYHPLLFVFVEKLAIVKERVHLKTKNLGDFVWVSITFLMFP